MLPESIAECPKLKVLRLEENCLTLAALHANIMKKSQISLLAIEGNVFEMKAFHNIEGYDEVIFNKIQWNYNIFVEEELTTFILQQWSHYDY